MGHTVTLGGDRLGSGKKQKVHLHGYERSTHDKSFLFKTTMSPGTLVPFLVEYGLPGDTWDIELATEIMTHPTSGPLFGSYKIQLDIFECPIRLYNAQMHNNKLKIGMKMSDIKLPVVDLLAKAFDPETVADIDNAQVNPSCILKYLGISGIGYIPPITEVPNALRTFQAIAWLGYGDIYKNYYANKMEEIGAVIHTPFQALIQTVDNVYIVNGPTANSLNIAPSNDNIQIFANGPKLVIEYTGTTPLPEQIVFNTSIGQKTMLELSQSTSSTPTILTGIYNYAQFGSIIFDSWEYIPETAVAVLPPRVQTFPLSEIDDMREAILTWQTNTPFHIEDAAGPGGPGKKPWSYIANFSSTNTVYTHTQEGLLLKTYQSDLFNNWLNTEWIDGTNGISEITAIDTTGGSFTIDTLNLSKKVYMMLNRIMVTGGSLNDWIKAVWDHDGFTKAETPIYHGGLIKELIFQEVVSNSAAQTTDNPTQPLGSLAGKGVLAKKHKGGQVRIKVDEPSCIMGIISITPRIEYSQGNAWHTRLETMDDFHKPQLDEIGFQELITEQMAWWDTSYNLLGGNWITKSAGKQPAWINYMTNVSKTYGNFAIPNNEMFMTLNRRYEFDTVNETIKDLTTYIDPSKHNFVFAQTSLDAMNFWVQVAVNITFRGKISAKVMPNL